MNDNLSIVITVIVMVVIIVIFPLYNFFERQDDMSYNVALSSVTEFVDQVLNNGYIDQTNYNNFLSKLSSTSNVYDVQLEAHRNIITNDTDNDNSKNYDIRYKVDYNDDIFKSMDSGQPVNITTLNSTVIKNNVYYLNVGDGFYVKLKNKNRTMASTIFNNIVPNSNNERISINYGGIVKSNSWAAIPNSNAIVNPEDLGETTRITGPYLTSDVNGTHQLSAIDDGSDIYFKAYYFNNNLDPKILASNIYYDNRSITALTDVANNCYKITYRNVRISDSSGSVETNVRIDNAAINVVDGVDSILSSKFTVYRDYIVTAVSDGNGNAYINDNGTKVTSKPFRYQSIINLVAGSGNVGYEFNYWSSSRGETSNQSNFYYTVLSAVTWTAHYKAMGPRNLSATMSGNTLVISWDAPQTGIRSYNVTINGVNYTGITTTHYNYRVTNPGNYTISVSAIHTDWTPSDSVSGVWNVTRTENTVPLYNEYYYYYSKSIWLAKEKKGNHTQDKYEYWYHTKADKEADNPYRIEEYHLDTSGTGKDSDDDYRRENDTYLEEIYYYSEKDTTTYSTYTSTEKTNHESSNQLYRIYKWNYTWSNTTSKSTDEDWEYTSETPVKEYEKDGKTYSRGLECEKNVRTDVIWKATKIQ